MQGRSEAWAGRRAECVVGAGADGVGGADCEAPEWAGGAVGNENEGWGGEGGEGGGCESGAEDDEDAEGSARAQSPRS